MVRRTVGPAHRAIMHIGCMYRERVDRIIWLCDLLMTAATIPIMVAADIGEARNRFYSVTKPSYVVDRISFVSSKLALDSPAIRKYRRFFFLKNSSTSLTTEFCLSRQCRIVAS